MLDNDNEPNLGHKDTAYVPVKLEDSEQTLKAPLAL